MLTILLVGVKSPCHGDALSLPTGQVNASFSDFRFIASWQRREILVQGTSPNCVIVPENGLNCRI